MSSATSSATARSGTVVALAAENEYANVIAQVGGKYVRVAALESNPDTDPHSAEASAAVSQEVSAAELIVPDGLGYDSFLTIESASPSPARLHHQSWMLAEVRALQQAITGKVSTRKL